VAGGYEIERLSDGGLGAGFRTFLFADLRRYARFVHEPCDDAASALASWFAEVVRVAVPDFDGVLLELRGDEAVCVFASSSACERPATATGWSPTWIRSFACTRRAGRRFVVQRAAAGVSPGVARIAFDGGWLRLRMLEL
jgi:class 3 adenylate cyclase